MMAELFPHFIECRNEGSLILAYGMGCVAGFAVALVMLAFWFSRER